MTVLNLYSQDNDKTAMAQKKQRNHSNFGCNRLLLSRFIRICVWVWVCIVFHCVTFYYAHRTKHKCQCVYPILWKGIKLFIPFIIIYCCSVCVCARRILHSTKKGFTKRSFCIIDDNLHFSYLFSNKLHGKCAGS